MLCWYCHYKFSLFILIRINLLQYFIEFIISKQAVLSVRHDDSVRTEPALPDDIASGLNGYSSFANHSPELVVESVADPQRHPLRFVDHLLTAHTLQYLSFVINRQLREKQMKDNIVFVNEFMRSEKHVTDALELIPDRTQVALPH